MACKRFVGSIPIASTSLTRTYACGSTSKTRSGLLTGCLLTGELAEQSLHHTDVGVDRRLHLMAVLLLEDSCPACPRTSAISSSGTPAADSSDAAEWRNSFGVQWPSAACSVILSNAPRRLLGSRSVPMVVVKIWPLSRQTPVGALSWSSRWRLSCVGTQSRVRSHSPMGVRLHQRCRRTLERRARRRTTIGAGDGIEVDSALLARLGRHLHLGRDTDHRPGSGH